MPTQKTPDMPTILVAFRYIAGGLLIKKITVYSFEEKPVILDSFFVYSLAVQNYGFSCLFYARDGLVTTRELVRDRLVGQLIAVIQL